MNMFSYICTEMEASKKNMAEAAYTLRAIAQETRLRIILLLSEKGEMSVNSLSTALNCEQSLLSHHLTDMRAKRILNVRKDGKNCFYSLKNEQIIQIIHCIQKCGCNEQTKNE